MPAHKKFDPKHMAKLNDREDGRLLIIDWKKEEMQEGPPLKIRCLPWEVGAQLKDAGFKRIAYHGFLKKHFCLTAEK